MKKEMPSLLFGSILGASIAIIGLLDWLTGLDLNFLVFYFAPVSLAAWRFGFGGSITAAVLCAVVWFEAGALAGQEYSSHFYAVWNTMIRLVSFLAIGWSVSKIRRLLDQEHQSAEALRRSLSEIKVLESFLPICAQCKKIRNQQGVWQQLEVYIGEHSNSQFSHGYCPECAKKAMAEAGLIDEETEQ